jgi:hypothetical protein
MKDKDCTIKNWGPYSEKKLQATKNYCWQLSKADWVIVCDVDEIADINLQDIEKLPEDVEVIRFQGYQMLSRRKKSIPLKDLTHGNLSNKYSKYVMFKPRRNVVVFEPGAHVARVSGIKSEKTYKLLHYNQSYLKHMNLSGMAHFMYKNIHRILEDKP